ncbi:CRP-like cAMP-binding protein [Pontibacter mucosus]|uniref:CRP-like cAMP-binding protein n=1 Tax=Pontibacter mucosus TaxID=1649266 RepID=A0A2T5Y4Y3_9BACT|nr:Crp/Fnr family transcriptional regulator [Pontibacter mucosus]PTX11348.1 CRP-like cAMP-binding protein [Pontibacter mucosus]
MMHDRLPLFLQSSGHVGQREAGEIATHFTRKEFAKHDFFLKEGRVSQGYLLLEEGAMRAFAYDTEGNEVTTGFFTKNQAVFEVSSFFNRVPSKENIQALSDCVGWCLTFEQLNHLFHTIPAFREFGRSVLVKGYAALKDRMLSTITETAEERYAHLLETKPELFHFAQLRHIASYLGITDSSLSRIRKEFLKK